MRIFFTIILFFLVSCAKKEKDYDEKKAVSAFEINDVIKIDSSLPAIKIPARQNLDNFSFTQNQTAENLTLASDQLNNKLQIWSGYKTSFDNRYVFHPIIADKTIFLLDTAGILSAFDAPSQKQIWEVRVFPRHFFKNYQNPRISYNHGRIFAICGTNEIAAISNKGEIIWHKKLSSLPLSAPVADDKAIYFSTSDNKLYSLDAINGDVLWTQSGVLRPTAILGVANPVIYKNFIIVAYSSGEIYLLDKKSGEYLWSKDLNITKAINSDFYLSDIDATPIVKDEIIYAIGNGGLMIAIDLKGNYIWKKEIAGIVDFWLAGDYLFIINNDNKLLALHKKTGGVKWFSQLPQFVNDKKLETKIIYSGVVMANDKLLITNNSGELLLVSPLDGKIEKTIKVGHKIFHAPVVVDGKIYLHSLGRYSTDLITIN